ncbi:MAG: LysR family transcriptional regulator [Luteimonas sp.]|nr:LysR family transcriptional regulator [Luteimonas sp.]
MDLRQLRYFLSVVEHGSFTRAAAASGRTQQALSKGIQALEQQLGARLFERGTREVRLTEVGRLLLEHARPAHDAVRRFEDRLQELQTGSEGQVRIGTGPSTAGSLVAPAVLALRRQWPRIGVHVAGGILPELLPGLLARELDAVVVLHISGDGDPDPRIQGETLAHDEYRVLASASHPLARQRDLRAGQLLEQPWIFGRRLGAVETAFRQRFHEAGLEPPLDTLVTGSPEFLRAMVGDGGYLTLLPSRLAQAELSSGRWRELDAPGFAWQRPIMVYTREGEPQNAPLARFLQALRNAARQVPATPPGPDP